MAQYATYTNNQFRYWTNSETGLLVRTGQRDHQFVEDCELETGGFALAEDVGWTNITRYADVIIEGGKVREGALTEDGENGYVIEGEKTTIGVWELIDFIH